MRTEPPLFCFFFMVARYELIKLSVLWRCFTTMCTNEFLQFLFTTGKTISHFYFLYIAIGERWFIKCQISCISLENISINVTFHWSFPAYRWESAQCRLWLKYRRHLLLHLNFIIVYCPRILDKVKGYWGIVRFHVALRNLSLE